MTIFLPVCENKIMSLIIWLNQLSLCCHCAVQTAAENSTGPGGSLLEMQHLRPHPPQTFCGRTWTADPRRPTPEESCALPLGHCRGLWRRLTWGLSENSREAAHRASACPPPQTAAERRDCRDATTYSTSLQAGSTFLRLSVCWRSPTQSVGPRSQTISKKPGP